MQKCVQNVLIFTHSRYRSLIAYNSYEIKLLRIRTQGFIEFLKNDDKFTSCELFFMRKIPSRESHVQVFILLRVDFYCQPQTLIEQ